MTTIAVVGATGTVGSRLVRQLASRGHQVRAISRHPEGAGDGGVEPVAADLTREAEATTALRGASAVYLTPPETGDDPLANEAAVVRNVIAAAASHDVEHVVMHTAVQADRGDTGARILDNKTPLELELAASGVPYTILRPAWYLQNLWAARDFLEQGMLSFPWPGDMAWAATDVNDVVAAAVAFLEGEPAGRGLDLHVPSGVSGDRLAEAAGRILERDVTYQPAEVSTRDFVEGFPISDVHKDLFAELFDYFRATTYLGDPRPITQVLDDFRIRGPEDFFRQELFVA